MEKLCSACRDGPKGHAGHVDLMPEMGYRPTNKYLPPRPRSASNAAEAPKLAPVSAEGGFLGWVDRMLSR